MAEHKAKFVEEAGLIDLCECSCGWTSRPYYDGRDFAYADWKRHVTAVNELPTAKE